MVPGVAQSILLIGLVNFADAVHTPNSEPTADLSPTQRAAPKAALRHDNTKQQAAENGFLTKSDNAASATKEDLPSTLSHLHMALNVATAMSRTTADELQDDIGALVQTWVRRMMSWPEATLARWQEGAANSVKGASGHNSGLPGLPRGNESIGQVTDELLKHLLTSSEGTAAIQQQLKILETLPVGTVVKASKANSAIVKSRDIASPSSNLAEDNSSKSKDEPPDQQQSLPVGDTSRVSNDQSKGEDALPQQQVMQQAEHMVQTSKEGTNAGAGVKDGASSQQNAAVQLLLKQLTTFQPKNEAQAKAVTALMVNLKQAYPEADPGGQYDVAGPDVGQIQSPNGQLAAGQPYPGSNPKMDEHFITALGGGTGARVGGTGDPVMDHHLVQRMHTQDLAVLIILFVIYLVTLFFGWSITYRMSHNSSPVKFYTNPRFHQLATEAQDVDGFLATFNSIPKEVRLDVAGFVETAAEVAHVEWRGTHYQTTFFFSLDLSQWVVSASECSSADRAKLRTYLGTTNSLETVDIHKDISWENWEELATNIKHAIRQNGFQGRIDVTLRGEDLVRVYQNHPWANFMHNRTTKALFALSIVGGLLYVPYMWLRMKRTSISTKFKVECRINDYWNLIHDKLCSHGFEAGNR